MDQGDIPTLLTRLRSTEDAVRKMAVFKLQSSINDPSFADAFITSGGLPVLQQLIMSTGGNTLAYALQSLSRLLEVDMGWQLFEASGGPDLVERTVDLIVNHRLVNILRGAMSILVAVVSHFQNGRDKIKVPSAFGFRALKPAIAVYPNFYSRVVEQLSSADHALCSNALSLLNALLQDVLHNDGGYVKDDQGKNTGMVEEWPKFVKRLQDMGVIMSVYYLMQGSALQDLAHPLLDFQTLSKALLRKWRDLKVDLDRPDHRRALKSVHHSSTPQDKISHASVEGMNGANSTAVNGNGLGHFSAVSKGSKKHNPEKWRRLGFETESPAWEFDKVGYLGMMDLNNFITKQADGYQKLLLEQSTKPMHARCPIARASIAVTLILYEHFEVDTADVQDARSQLVLDGMRNYDRIFRPLILQWSRVHVAALQAFFRLWKATVAEQDDFEKVADLVRILVSQVVGQATRNKDIIEIEEQLKDFEYSRLRDFQIQLLESAFDREWGRHLKDVKGQLHSEAVQFIKEQRIRCLLQGSWFELPEIKANSFDPDDSYAIYDDESRSLAKWRFVKLSYNRHFLHYADFLTRSAKDPELDELAEVIKLKDVRSVGSSLMPGEPRASNVSDTTLKEASRAEPRLQIIINTFDPPPGGSTQPVERALLALYPADHNLGSEWLDGLLMLLGQKPITSETNRLIAFIGDYGLKNRLLNLRQDDRVGHAVRKLEMPTRSGLDDDYYYDV